MNRKQRNTLIVGVVLTVAAAACPPWSYYGGEVKWSSHEGPRALEAPDDAPPLARGPQLERDINIVHGIRGLAILVVFVVTVILYLKFASGPTDETERPGRKIRVFWIVFAAVAVFLLAIPLWILLVQLIRSGRG